jgi:hypothetical protein
MYLEPCHPETLVQKVQEGDVGVPGLSWDNLFGSRRMLDKTRGYRKPQSGRRLRGMKKN